MSNLDETKISQTIENTLKLLGLTTDNFSVSFSEDKTVKVQITLDDNKTGLYIGNHGEGVSSLQLILSLMINQRFGDWVHIIVNINDYRERREESLKQMAENAATKARDLDQEIIIPNLSPFERRAIHLCLENNPDVVTQSRGDGPNRQLFIVPKSKID